MKARKRLLDAMGRCLETTPIDNLKVGEIVALADKSAGANATGPGAIQK